MKIAGAALLLLAACDGGTVVASSNMVEGRTATAAPDDAMGAVYVCADGRRVRTVFTDPETLTLHIGDTPVPMRATTSAKGARYIGGGWQWRTKGLQQATLAPLKSGEAAASSTGVTCKVR